jgi:hypothetical protein
MGCTCIRHEAGDIRFSICKNLLRAYSTRTAKHHSNGSLKVQEEPALSRPMHLVPHSLPCRAQLRRLFSLQILVLCCSLDLTLYMLGRCMALNEGGKVRKGKNFSSDEEQ